MATSVYLSQSFDEMPIVRDALRRRVHEHPRLELDGMSRAWSPSENEVAANLQELLRPDVLMIAIPLDGSFVSTEQARIQEEIDRGVPVFLCWPSTAHDVRDPWLRAVAETAVHLRLLEQPEDAVDRVIDRLEDRLLSGVVAELAQDRPGQTPWLRSELVALGVVERLRPGEREQTEPIHDEELVLDRFRAFECLIDGRLRDAAECLAGERRGRWSWSIEYLDGRLAGWQRDDDALRRSAEALGTADRRFDDLGRFQNVDGNRVLLQRLATVEALVRVCRRHRDWGRRAERHLQKLEALVALLPPERKRLSLIPTIERTRLCGRQGPDAAAAATQSLRAVALKDPLLAAVLVNAVDLDLIREHAKEVLAGDVREAITTSLATLGDDRTLDPAWPVRQQVVEARRIARGRADALAANYRELGHLIPDRSLNSRWASDVWRATADSLQDKRSKALSDLTVLRREALKRALRLGYSSQVLGELPVDDSSEDTAEPSGLIGADLGAPEPAATRDQPEPTDPAPDLDADLRQAENQLAETTGRLGDLRRARDGVVEPSAPEGVRFTIAVTATLASVLMAVLMMLLHWAPIGVLVAFVVAVAIAISCWWSAIGPRLDRWQLDASIHRWTASETQQQARAADLADLQDRRRGIHHLVGQLHDVEKSIVAARTGLAAARAAEEIAAVRLGLPKDSTPREMLAVVISRHISFNDAFGNWPTLWWSNVDPYPPLQAGAIAVVRPSESAPGGLLAEDPCGQRLVRVAGAKTVRLSDIAALFRESEQGLATELESALIGVRRL